MSRSHSDTAAEAEMVDYMQAIGKGGAATCTEQDTEGRGDPMLSAWERSCHTPPTQHPTPCQLLLVPTAAQQLHMMPAVEAVWLQTCSIRPHNTRSHAYLRKSSHEAWPACECSFVLDEACNHKQQHTLPYITLDCILPTFKNSPMRPGLLAKVFLFLMKRVIMRQWPAVVGTTYTAMMRPKAGKSYLHMHTDTHKHRSDVSDLHNCMMRTASGRHHIHRHDGGNRGKVIPAHAHRHMHTCTVCDCK